MHEGLKIDAGDNNLYTNARIRGGRQKTANADADDFAYTGRVKYAGMPGLEIAAALQYQSDLTQSGSGAIDDGLLFETHLAYNRGPFGLRALYAGWDLDADDNYGDGGHTIEANGYDEQEGWYVEPSYKFNDNVGVFTRYEDVEGGRSRDHFDQWTAGINVWLHENVVLKADYQDREHDNEGDQGRDFDGFNLGVGYQF